MDAAMDDRNRMRTLLIEAISTLCRNGLKYREEITVDGLIGITLDKQDVFLVKIQETFTLAKESNETSTCVTDHSSSKSSSKKRVKHPRTDFDEYSSGENTETGTSIAKYRRKADVSRRNHESEDSQSEPVSTSPKESGDLIVIEDPDQPRIKAEGEKPERWEACRLAETSEAESVTCVASSTISRPPLPHHAIANPDRNLSRFANNMNKRDSSQANSDTGGFEPGEIHIFAQEVKEEQNSDSDLIVFKDEGDMVGMPSRPSHLATQPNALTMAGPGPSVFPGVPLAAEADWATPSASQEFIPMPENDSLQGSPQLGSNLSSTSQQVTAPPTALAEYDQGGKPLFACVMCRKTFTERSNGLRHIKNLHGGSTGCRCPVCDKALSRPDYLLTHMRSVHKQTITSRKTIDT